MVAADSARRPLLQGLIVTRLELREEAVFVEGEMLREREKECFHVCD